VSPTGIIFTHMKARELNKPAFFFSRFTFKQMKERGNTHYCFHCGGDYGFTPGENGEATNCEDDMMYLYRQDKSEVKVRDALKDANLEPHIADTPGYPRRKPGYHGYEKWLDYDTSFIYDAAFAKWCVENGYTVYRYNSMKHHDPVTHANAIISGAEKYEFVSDWLRSVKLPKDFPYIVSLT